MANKNLFKKIAPVILSATVAFSGMPATAFAADLSDAEVAVAEENTDTEDADVDVAEDAADDAEVDVEEAEEVDEETAEEDASEEDLFSSEEEDAVDVGDGTADALTGEYQYVYAGLTWSQYWASEPVYKAGDTTSSSVKDRKGEYDKGAFDAVTRATTNHGLHRGSFQSIATIYGESGKVYPISHWEDNGATLVLTDGSKVSYSKGVIDGTDALDHYVVTGIKYVPVKVKTSDYEEFCKQYAVVVNGGTLTGGYSENKLSSYTATAEVTENTNGLKEAVKNADGSFSFTARKNGSDSGLKDTELKTAEGIEPTVKEANGSYGEFLRVDLNGNYGGLGSAMQAVEWTYYGNDSTYSTPITTYGTKFAADNWMHKSMGIQLGLTKSVRCQLPDGYDGTGYWTIKVMALGYNDYTYNFQATDANIVQATAGNVDTAKFEAVLAQAKALDEKEYTADSWYALQQEVKECDEMLENIDEQTQAALDEQVGHLTEAIEKLVKLTIAVNPASTTLTVGGTATLKVETNITGNVTWTSSNTAVATVANGVVTAKAAGSATITATVGEKSATCAITVKAVEQKPVQPTQKPTQDPTQTPVVKAGITANVAQVYVGKKATIKVTKTQVTGKATFKSSNKKVATVNSKGVITGKKAGKTVITVKVGKYTKKLTVTVKKPSFKLTKSSAKLKKGQKVTIKSKAAPASKVTYKTSNKKVATVNSKGVVTAKKKGTAKITVKCNGITKTFKVTVK